jgi:hypothetical protein
MGQKSRNQKSAGRTVKILTLLLAFPGLVMAECYQESVTVNQAQAEIREVADYQKFVKTVGSLQTCTVMFRARVNNKWYDARGESQGLITDSTDQICSQALQVGRTKILEKIQGTAVHSSQTLYCNDFQTPQLRQGLKKNDTFRVSELKPHPGEPKPFEHKGTVCRYFLESDINPKTNALMQWEIMGCLIRNEWTVVDKF